MDKRNYKLYKGAWIFSGGHCEERKITIAQARSLLDRGGYFVRNVFDFDCNEETSFWYVIKDSFGGMEELSSKMRNQVRKSLKVYDIKRIPPEEFLRIAYPIYNEALESYRVKTAKISREQIERIVDEQHDYWVVYVKNTDEAVAVALNTCTETYCEYNTLKATPESMHNSTYPYYGLIYEMNKYYLGECGLRYVCDGARSITEHSNIQPFLISKFHFRKAYCHIAIFYKPLLRQIVKVLYPFRRLIRLFENFAIIYKMSALLKMEEFAREDRHR